MLEMSENWTKSFEERMDYWTDEQVLGQVYKLQKLLNMSEMQESCLVDDAQTILDMLKDECVWRLCQLVKRED